MNYLKIVTIFNSVVIALLFLLVAAETLFPTKGGGDAASGMGRAIYYLAIIALVLLVTLNLLPFKWSKYTAFILVAVPLFWVAFGSSISNFTRGITNMMRQSHFLKIKKGTGWLSRFLMRSRIN